MAVDGPRGPLLCELTLPADANIAVALQEARRQLDPGLLDPPIDWEGAAVGIWGERCERSAVPRGGDRIELYRSLTVDPRQRRRQRVRATRAR